MNLRCNFQNLPLVNMCRNLQATIFMAIELVIVIAVIVVVMIELVVVTVVIAVEKVVLVFDIVVVVVAMVEFVVDVVVLVVVVVSIVVILIIRVELGVIMCLCHLIYSNGLNSKLNVHQVKCRVLLAPRRSLKAPIFTTIEMVIVIAVIVVAMVDLVDVTGVVAVEKVVLVVYTVVVVVVIVEFVVGAVVLTWTMEGVVVAARVRTPKVIINVQ
jgi:hypothetical protein